MNFFISNEKSDRMFSLAEVSEIYRTGRKLIFYTNRHNEESLVFSCEDEAIAALNEIQEKVDVIRLAGWDYGEPDEMA